VLFMTVYFMLLKYLSCVLTVSHLASDQVLGALMVMENGMPALSAFT